MGRRPHGFWGSPLLIALPPLVGPQALVKKPIRALALLLPLSAPPWCSPLLSSLVSCSLLIPHPPLKPPPSLPPSLQDCEFRCEDSPCGRAVHCYILCSCVFVHMSLFQVYPFILLGFLSYLFLLVCYHGYLTTCLVPLFCCCVFILCSVLFIVGCYLCINGVSVRIVCVFSCVFSQSVY